MEFSGLGKKDAGSGREPGNQVVVAKAKSKILEYWIGEILEKWLSEICNLAYYALQRWKE